MWTTDDVWGLSFKNVRWEEGEKKEGFWGEVIKAACSGCRHKEGNAFCLGVRERKTKSAGEGKEKLKRIMLTRQKGKSKLKLNHEMVGLSITNTRLWIFPFILWFTIRKSHPWWKKKAYRPIHIEKKKKNRKTEKPLSVLNFLQILCL